MRKLTKIALPALMAASLLGGAGLASAQPYGGHGDAGPGRPDRAHDSRPPAPDRSAAIRSQLDDLQREAERGGRPGLRRDIQSVRAQLFRFSRDGLNAREAHTLQIRIDTIRARLHAGRDPRSGHGW